jgi:hypothetical protein
MSCVSWGYKVLAWLDSLFLLFWRFIFVSLFDVNSFISRNGRFLSVDVLLSFRRRSAIHSGNGRFQLGPFVIVISF